MRAFPTCFLAGCLLAGMISAPMLADEPVAEKPQPDAKSAREPSVWMRKKLDYSQDLLKGLALADFDAIKTSGAQMRLLNQVEGFVRRRNPRYTQHLKRFQSICNEIVREADAENLPGVTLAFNQLTVNCVNCHRSLRTRAEPAAE